MKIIISNKKKIFEIQKEFNDCFPFLQIQFYTRNTTQKNAPGKFQLLDSQKSIEDCRTLANNKTITIEPTITVKELEQNFLDTFGIVVQIFRKSGKAWLETNVTDTWTLTEQNKEGQALSRVIKSSRPPDFNG